MTIDDAEVVLDFETERSLLFVDEIGFGFALPEERLDEARDVLLLDNELFDASFDDCFVNVVGLTICDVFVELEIGFFGDAATRVFVPRSFFFSSLNVGVDGGFFTVGTLFGVFDLSPIGNFSVSFDDFAS